MEETLNRRSSPRARIRGVATISLRNRRVKCGMQDVGVGGMAVRSSAPLPTGSFLRIHFPLPGGCGHLDSDAVLVRRQNKGREWLWAVRFENPQPHVIENILDYVHRSRGDLPTPAPSGSAAASTAGGGVNRAAEELRELALKRLYRQALQDLYGR